MPKMTEDDWKSIKYFNTDEAWGDPYQMDRDLIFLLDELRSLFHYPFIVHCGYDTKGHSENSQHYIGKAVDFHIQGIDFQDAIDLMLKFIGPYGLGVANIVGMGIYPDWNSSGFHLDTRGFKARWGRIIKHGVWAYVSFGEAYNQIKE